MPHDGLGTTGVSPVPPSIKESKLNPGIPEEGVVIAMPAISCQLLEERGGGGALVKGDATGNDVGRGRGAAVGLWNSIKPSDDEDSSLSFLSSLIMTCCGGGGCGALGIGIRLGKAGNTDGLLLLEMHCACVLRIILHCGR